MSGLNDLRVVSLVNDQGYLTASDIQYDPETSRVTIYLGSFIESYRD